MRSNSRISSGESALMSETARTLAETLGVPEVPPVDDRAAIALYPLRLSTVLGYPASALSFEPLYRYKSRKFRPDFVLRATKNRPSIIGELSFRRDGGVTEQLTEYMVAASVNLGIGITRNGLTLVNAGPPITAETLAFNSAIKGGIADLFHQLQQAPLDVNMEPNDEVFSIKPPQPVRLAAEPTSKPQGYASAFTALLDTIIIAQSNKEKKDSLEQFAKITFDSYPYTKSKFTNLRTRSSEIDIVCIHTAPAHHFLSEFGRCFLVECKNWSRPVGAKEIRDFIGKLEKTRTRLGIYFSKKGITGESGGTDAYLEIHSVYDRSGILVITLNLQELMLCQTFEDVIDIIETKVDELRFDFHGQSASRD